MNSMALKTGAKYAACGGAILCGVALLTLIFNVLGTISCAVLTGMMFGATRHPRWVTLPLSLLFPAAIFALLGLNRTELDARQVAMVAGACFGAFWLTYGASAYMIFCEQQPSAGSPAKSGERPPRGLHAASQVLAGDEPAGADLLRGKWLREVHAAGGVAETRVLEIDQAGLRLSAVDANGRVRVLAQGEIRLRS